MFPHDLSQPMTQSYVSIYHRTQERKDRAGHSIKGSPQAFSSLAGLVSVLLWRDSGGEEFVATKSGLRCIQLLNELLNALESVSTPTGSSFGE
jgi:hypothetical protein